MIVENGKYYIYQHTRLDTNEPFYIGVGTKIYNDGDEKRIYKRAYRKSYRNNIWNKIIKKSDYKVDILMESDNKEFLFQKEIELIEKYGRICINTGILSNITEGGDGVNYGFERSKEEKYRRSIGVLPIEKRKEIVKMYINGKGVTEISKTLHSCTKVIRKVLKEFNVSTDKYTIMREDGLKFKTEKEACDFEGYKEGTIHQRIVRKSTRNGYRYFRINEPITL